MSSGKHYGDGCVDAEQFDEMIGELEPPTRNLSGTLPDAHAQRMDDVRAVMDAAGSERATPFGISEGEHGRVGQVREDQREDAGDASCLRH